MKNVLVLGVAALALVGCGKKEEAAPAPAAEAAAPADAAPGELVVGTNENGAPVVNGGPNAVGKPADDKVEAPAPAAK